MVLFARDCSKSDRLPRRTARCWSSFIASSTTNMIPVSKSLVMVFLGFFFMMTVASFGQPVNLWISFVLFLFQLSLTGATATQRTQGGSGEPALTRFRPNDAGASFGQPVSLFLFLLFFFYFNYYLQLLQLYRRLRAAQVCRR